MMGFRKRWVAPAFVSWVCTIGEYHVILFLGCLDANRMQNTSVFGVVTLILYNKIHWVIPGAGQVTTTVTIFLAIFTNVLVTFLSGMLSPCINSPGNRTNY
jgi:hypothetical protein